MNDKDFKSIETATDVTAEILEMTEGIHDGWFDNDSVIDWDHFIDRLDGRRLDNGLYIDMGDNMGSPAINKIKRHIRNYRKC